jgi:hypothetical protein
MFYFCVFAHKIPARQPGQAQPARAQINRYTMRLYVPGLFIRIFAA